MGLRHLGFLFIILGFACPYVLVRLFPMFIYALVPSFPLFWAGFLFALKPDHKSDNSGSILAWATYGILLNIILMLIVGCYFWIILRPNNEHAPALEFMHSLNSIANPVRHIFDMLVPQPMERQADGSVLVITSFLRSQVTYFMSLALYSVIPVIVKSFVSKKDNLATSADRKKHSD